MKELKFKSQICTTMEQSKRLLELGLKPETADMHHFKQAGEFLPHLGFFIDSYKNIPNWYQPAWSLHRLLSIGINGDYMGLWNININKDTVGELFEQLIRLIEWAIKNGEFNEDYLK